MFGLGINKVYKFGRRLVAVVGNLFVPSGSDSLITSDGDVFRVQ